MTLLEDEVQKREVGGRRFGAQSMVGRLRWVLVHEPGPEYNVENWKAWPYEGEPSFERASEQHRAVVDALRATGAEVSFLEEEAVSLGATAPFDPVLVTDEGAVILRSGRPERRAEMFPMARKMAELEIPILGW